MIKYEVKYTIEYTDAEDINCETHKRSKTELHTFEDDFFAAFTETPEELLFDKPAL